MGDRIVCTVESLNFGKYGIDTDFRKIQIVSLHGSQYWLSEYQFEIYTVTQRITNRIET